MKANRIPITSNAITFYRIFDIVLFLSIYHYFSLDASSNLRSFTDIAALQNPTCGL